MELGFRFRPNDEELIRYLLKFVCCKNYSCDDIRFDDLYGNKKPWEIFYNNSTDDDTDAKTKYFFTQLKKKKSDNKKFIRRLRGGGTWKGLDKGIFVVNKGSNIVGLKKNYRYEEKSSCDDRLTNITWSMKEYNLDEKILKVLRE